jgi:hypothetical protein
VENGIHAVVKTDPMWIYITTSDCFRGKTIYIYIYIYIIFKDRNPRRVI